MKIPLFPYDNEWPRQFERERALLQDALGPAVAAIEHIGSTAVPGLIAKPIIDIMIGLADFDPADRLVPSLVKRGYTYIPQYEDLMPFRRYLEKWQEGRCTHHLHMVALGGEFWIRHLAFRDRLRREPAAAAAYAALKTGFALRDWRDGNEYAEAKTEFIRRMEKGAGP